MNRTITEPFSAGPPAGPPGRVLPPLHPGRLRPVRPADGGLPRDPVRVVRRRRRPVRPGDARVRAAGLDERRHRRDRAPADPVGDVAGVPAELDGRPRRGGPEPPDRPDHADRDAGRGRVLRRLRLRARPDRADRRRNAPRSPPRSRSTRRIASCSSAAGSCACAARSRATATRPPGWSSRPTGRRAIVGYVQALNRPVPAADSAAPARSRSGARSIASRAGRATTATARRGTMPACAAATS